MVVYKENQAKGVKVDILTGYQLDNLLESASYRESVSFVSPLGMSYTPTEYRIGRKLD